MKGHAKATARMVDGYAVQNTAHVLCALKAFAIKERSSTRTEATVAAIKCYAALSHRHVSARSVRRWLVTVESYGGIQKTPNNAFGVRKSCPHFTCTIRGRLRQIEAVACRLLSFEKKGEIPMGSRRATGLALIDRALEDCASRGAPDPIRRHLSSIRQTARCLQHRPIDQLYRVFSPAELEAASGDILARLKAMAVKRAGKAA